MVVEKKVENAAGVIAVCGHLPHHYDQFGSTAPLKTVLIARTNRQNEKELDVEELKTRPG